MTGTFVIEALPEQALRYRDDHAIVAIDVFRATTTIVTALSLGWRVYPANDELEARELAAQLPEALLAGELAGSRPPGFAFNNSPAAIAAIDDRRALILLSSAGTRLLGCTRGSPAVYIACFRNLSALSAHLSQTRTPLALIGAGARGRSRPEDSMACARLGRALMMAGFTPENARTADEMQRWADVEIEAVRIGPSADFLRATGQEADIDFVIEHVDDLDIVVTYDGREAVADRFGKESGSA
jgi:2-phosphosulfolactate phosphatase